MYKQFNTTELQAGSPVFMSWAHFLHGDPELREDVEGIDPPDRDLHSFQLDIQPDWGTTLAANARCVAQGVVAPKIAKAYMNDATDPGLIPNIQEVTGAKMLNGTKNL